MCSRLFRHFIIVATLKTESRYDAKSLRWRQNGRDSVSNHQPHDCLLNRLFRRRSKKTSQLRVTGPCAGNSPGTGEFPAQMPSNAKNVSMWWRHHVSRQWWHRRLCDATNDDNNNDNNNGLFSQELHMTCSIIATLCSQGIFDSPLSPRYR